MNAAPAEPPVYVPPPPVTGWRGRKLVLVILFALATHLAFIFLLGAKKSAPPRAVTNIPVLHLADNASELVRLTDPTLFVLPHADDFAPAVWRQPPAIDLPRFSWTEAPRYLTNIADLGTTFIAFMATNQFAPRPLNFKPEPRLSATPEPSEPAYAQATTWTVTGELAGRQILNPFTAPSPAVNDVIAPSRVQLLVAPSGQVLSTVLLASDDPLTADSHYAAADQTAVELARALRFAPASRLMFGEILFNWHTLPVAATNAP